MLLLLDEGSEKLDFFIPNIEHLRKLSTSR